MLNGKWVSIKDVINRFYRDSKAQSDVNWADLVEWVFEALEVVGYPDQYIKKVIGYQSNPEMDVENYRFKLPCDFHALVQLAVDQYPVTYNGNTFHHLLAGDCCGLNVVDDESSGDSFVDGFGNVFNTALGIKHPYGPLTFDINNDYVTLSVKTGKACMSYLAHPTDKEGYPLIPDDESYKKAVSKYLIMMYDYGKWRMEPSNAGLRALYTESSREYEWYIAQAGNAGKMPDISKMELIKNQYLRLIPKINQYDSFFTAANVPEMRKIH